MARFSRVGWTVLIASIAGVIYSSSCHHSSAQPALDPRLIGTWIHKDTGVSLEIKDDMTINLAFTGQADVFSGHGTVQSCTRQGANLCIAKERFDCAYYYRFTGPERMNLQFKTGRPEVGCQAANGDYQREH